MAVRSRQVSRGTGKVFQGDFGKRFTIARRWCAALGTGGLKAIGHVDVLKGATAYRFCRFVRRSEMGNYPLRMGNRRYIPYRSAKWRRLRRLPQSISLAAWRPPNFPTEDSRKSDMLTFTPQRRSPLKSGKNAKTRRNALPQRTTSRLVLTRSRPVKVGKEVSHALCLACVVGRGMCWLGVESERRKACRTRGWAGAEPFQ